MKKLYLLAMVGLLPILLACEHTRVIRQGNALAESGKAYADAMIPLADLVLSERLDRKFKRLADERKAWPSERLIAKPSTEYRPFVTECQSHPMFDTPSKLRACIDGFVLDHATSEMRKYREELAIYKRHTMALSEYFAAVNSFVDADVKTMGEASVKESATALSVLGDELGRTFKISAGQVTGLEALGGVAFTVMHGNDVKKLLDQHVEMIGRQLALQHAALGEFSKLLQQEEKRDSLSIENYFLRPAFVAGADKAPRPDLPSDWLPKWAAVVKEESVIELLKTALSASKTAHTAWKNFVEGRANFNDLNADISLTKGAVNAVRKIHEAR